VDRAPARGGGNLRTGEAEHAAHRGIRGRLGDGGLDHARLARIQRARSRAQRVPRDAQMANRIPWCVISSPTEAWARTVFGPSGTVEQLWKVLVPILRLDSPDPPPRISAATCRGSTTVRRLTEMGIRSLRFRGPVTDLRVALSPSAHWLGGMDTTPEGKVFMPNIPSEEVFTTPDFGGTEGAVTATRRARLHGAVVEGARLEFREGQVVSCSATRGGDALGASSKRTPGPGCSGRWRWWIRRARSGRAGWSSIPCSWTRTRS
jgi:aminopeptidase